MGIDAGRQIASVVRTEFGVPSCICMAMARSPVIEDAPA